ncbi:GPI-anchored small secreted protein [Lyophyllum atratum]|nr:GPI-anchored small secreted protein [Lyophyllum atratum]
MRFSAALCLSFVAAALAYQITEPSTAKGWSDTGAQTIAWTRNSNDPSNFTVVLDNGSGNQVLAAQVDGNLNTITVNPPSGGWPTAGSFRVIFAQDPENLSTVLAQSSDFDIKAPTTSGTTHTSTVPTIGTTANVPSKTAVIPATTTAIAPSSTTGVGDNNGPEQNAAISTFSVPSSLVPFFAPLCFFFALILA